SSMTFTATRVSSSRCLATQTEPIPPLARARSSRYLPPMTRPSARLAARAADIDPSRGVPGDADGRAGNPEHLGPPARVRARGSELMIGEGSGVGAYRKSITADSVGPSDRPATDKADNRRGARECSRYRVGTPSPRRTC